MKKIVTMIALLFLTFASFGFIFLNENLAQRPDYELDPVSQLDYSKIDVWYDSNDEQWN